MSGEPRPWLLTGASGFLGRHLLEAHAASREASAVLALVRDPAGWDRMDWTAPLSRVRPLPGSVTASDAWSADLPRLGGIVHLAAVIRHSRHEPEPMLETNVEGALAMVRLAAEHGCRLVLLSTSGTVGVFRDPSARADETAPFCDDAVQDWPYYRSKIRMEREAAALARELGVELVVLRPPILLGPGDHRFRSTGNVLRVLRGKLPFLVPGGMHFADVRDAAGAILRARFRPDPQPVYHLPGTICGLEEFFALLEEISGAPAPRWVLPAVPARNVASTLNGLGVMLRGEPFELLPDPVLIEMASHHWGATSLHAASDLDYKSRDPRETLHDTVVWLRENHEALAPSSELAV